MFSTLASSNLARYERSCRPNTLTSYLTHPQLGVLGWTHEFSELIDAIKVLAFDGNMFIATREQALITCSEILKLNLNIRIQIITMYLSAQVARLRRFLDGETTFTDYPDADFPLEQRQYTEWTY